MPIPATNISRRWGSIEKILQTASPPAAAAAIVIAIQPALRISTLLLERLFDHQVHARRQSEHRANHNPPGRPAIFLVQPPAHDAAEADTDSDLQSDACHRTPVGVLIVRHRDLRFVARGLCLFAQTLLDSNHRNHKTRWGRGPKE